VSPVPRHRGQPFASIPEDHALDDSSTVPVENDQPERSRGSSPEASWDFSLDESDSVSDLNLRPSIASKEVYLYDFFSQSWFYMYWNLSSHERYKKTVKYE